MYQLAGAAASVLGGVLQAVAANQAKHAMEKAFRQELINQAGHRNEAFGTFESALPSMGVETAREQMATGAAHRQGLYEDVGGRSLSAVQPQGFGPTGVDKAQYSLMSEPRAKLGSYSDWQLEQMIKRIRTQDELNKIIDFSRGEAQVFPYKMQDAQHSGDKLAFIGSLISSLGGAAGSFGALSGGGGAASNANYGLGMYDLPSGFQDQFAGYV